MELFTKTKVVKLRSHLDKYLLADNDGETIRQSSTGLNTRNSKWVVEVVETRQNAVRFKTLNGKYLMGSDKPFLIGVTGKRVIQTTLVKPEDWKLEWEIIRDGFQVKIKSWCGKFLRANGGPPPWRNSVTHDEPLTGATASWILWDVEPVDVGEATETVAEYLSFISSFSSVPEDVLEAAVSDDYSFEGSEPGSPVSVSARLAPRLTLAKSMSPRLSPKKSLDFLHIMQRFGVI